MWETQRLVVANVTVADAGDYAVAFGDRESARFLGSPDPGDAVEWASQIARWTAGAPKGSTDEWLNFSVRLQEFGRPLVGRLQATVHGFWAEVAWVFSSAQWRRGYATEAGRWLVAHLADRGIDTIVASVDPGNRASVGLLNRIGFSLTEIPGLVPDSYDSGDFVNADRKQPH